MQTLAHNSVVAFKDSVNHSSNKSKQVHSEQDSRNLNKILANKARSAKDKNPTKEVAMRSRITLRAHSNQEVSEPDCKVPKALARDRYNRRTTDSELDRIRIRPSKGNSKAKVGLDRDCNNLSSNSHSSPRRTMVKGTSILIMVHTKYLARIYRHLISLQIRALLKASIINKHFHP